MLMEKSQFLPCTVTCSTTTFQYFYLLGLTEKQNIPKFCHHFLSTIAEETPLLFTFLLRNQCSDCEDSYLCLLKVISISYQIFQRRKKGSKIICLVKKLSVLKETHGNSLY